MPSLMDSAVLLSPAAAPAEQQLPSGGLQESTMQVQLFAPGSGKDGATDPPPAAAAASGLLCSVASGDWHILSAAEISTALPPSAAAAAGNGGGGNDISADSPVPTAPPPPLPISPAKAKPKSRRGKAKGSPAKRALTGDGTDADVEDPAECGDDSSQQALPPATAATAQAPGVSRAPSATEDATAAASGKPLRMWNPFAGLKLIGSCHKAAGSHILDLHPPVAMPTPAPVAVDPVPDLAGVATAMAGSSTAAAPAPVTPAKPTAAATPADGALISGGGGGAKLCDSVPDIDAVMDDGSLAAMDAAGATACDAAAPDHDTAQEGAGRAAGLAGSKAATDAGSKLSDAAATPSAVSGGGASAINLTASVPAAASDYKMPPKGGSKQLSAKQRKKKGRKLR